MPAVEAVHQALTAYCFNPRLAAVDNAHVRADAAMDARQELRSDTYLNGRATGHHFSGRGLAER